MFFRLFDVPKNKLPIKIINLILLTCFIIYMNGCSTTQTKQYPIKDVKNNKNIKITLITLKNGQQVNTKNKTVVYKENYKDSINVFLIMSDADSLIEGKEIHLRQTSTPGVYDTIYVKANITKKSNKVEQIIPISDVLEIFVENEETDVGLTIIATIGVIVGLVVILYIIIGATKHSCPLIYAFDGNKYVFDGEPLGGVICDGLTRTDYSRMENLSPSDGKFKLLIRNEANEKQFLDEIKLLVVSHNEDTYVTPNPEGEFFSYKTIVQPESVIDENGNDVSVFFKEKDNIKWQTQMPYDTSFKGGVEKHNLKFKFPRPEGAKSALLFVNCGTALWGSNMIKEMLQLRGSKVDDWYSNVNSGGSEMLKLYQFMEREELFTLEVNLLEGDKYSTKTYIPAGGPLIDEDKIIRLPLENVTGNFVEFTLNPPAGYWKIDQIGIIYDYELIDKDKIQKLDAVYAIDQDGIDFRNNINAIDKKYYNMPEVGNTSNVYFDVPSDFSRNKNEIFLKTTGYYEVNIDKQKNEQKELIEEIMTTPGRIIQYSMALYNQKIKELVVNKSFNSEGIK